MWRTFSSSRSGCKVVASRLEASEQFRDIIRELAASLDPGCISWAVTGAVAANRYRDQVRTTADLDVLLAVAEKGIEDVADVLKDHGWTTLDVIDGWLLRANHPQKGRLDLSVAQTEYEKGAIARSEQVTVEHEYTYKTLAIEDVLILKLVANRLQDDADIESILFTQPTLDWSYMSKWMEVFDLEDRLNRIVDRAVSDGALNTIVSYSSDSPKCSPNSI